MKKAILLIGLILLTGLIFGQKSLFDIEFDASLESADTILKAQGFTEINRVGSTITYSPTDIPDLTQLDLRINPETQLVISWELRYDTRTNEGVVNRVVDQLIAIHGEYQVYDDYDYDFIWYFDTGKAIYVSEYNDGRLVLYYTTGNWDDDDYYYYEYYGW